MKKLVAWSLTYNNLNILYIDKESVCLKKITFVFVLDQDGSRPQRSANEKPSQTVRARLLPNRVLFK